MTLSDEEPTVYSLREAQLILSVCIEPGTRNAEKTIQDLLEVLDRNDVVEAVDWLTQTVCV